MRKKLQPLESLLSLDDIERLHHPIAEATGLPGTAYGTEFYEIERHTLFRSRWCVIGVGAEIPQAGDVMEVELAGWPLLAVRTQTGEIRCFYNICRHRANRLVEGKHKGMSRLSCSWHGWTYDLEGNLLSTPDFGGGGVHQAEDFCRASLGLKRVPASTWLDYILVNLDGTAPPLEEHLQPLNQFLSSYDFSGLCYSSSARFEYPGNWKVGIEGAIEDYHVPWGHGQMVRHLYQVRDTAGIETRFSPHWEGAVHHFQRMVVDAVSGSGA